MIKIFTSHLWVVGRTAYGLPTDRPWIVSAAHGGHSEDSYITVNDVFPDFDLDSVKPKDSEDDEDENRELVSDTGVYDAATNTWTLS